MNAVSRFLMTSMVMLATTRTFSVASAQETLTARDVAARLNAGMTDGPSYIRLRMEITAAGGKSTLQLQLKGRRTKEGSDILYQVLFPKERKGESVLLQRRPGRAATGKVLLPASSAVQNITSMKDSMLGSDLSYEDIIENFYAWEQQSFVGTEEVNKTACQILESKPGGGDRSSYSRVRSWIDLKKMVPLRVEKYSGSNLVRRIETTRVAKDDNDRPVPASLNVQRPGHDTSTELEGSNSRHDVVYSDNDFTPQGMQSLAPPASK